LDLYTSKHQKLLCHSIPPHLWLRARYFAVIDELRTNGSRIFWHDETWCNQNEERRFVWTDGTTDIGRMRRSQNKGVYYFFCISTDYSP
jgi:hypothetical protein